jgi:N6-adenosine-specific RNA methylase IME4
VRFSCVIADCPFSFGDQLKQSSVKRGASSNYDTMTIDELCALPVKDIIDPGGCILAFWVPSSMLEDGIRIMKSWGNFEIKSTYVWVKTKQNKSLGKLLSKVSNYLPIVDNISETVKVFIGDALLAFGMGRLFRQTHEICLIGINNTKIYKKLENKSQRSVCFAENQGHSIKPENLHRSLEIMFPDSKKIEIFARRAVNGWTTIGNQVCNGEDIRVSIEKLKNA